MPKPNTDPTLEEMLSHLVASFYLDEAIIGDYVDCAEAIYWFSADWHDGQDSNLYSNITRCGYRPGMYHRKPTTELSQDIYACLKREFTWDGWNERKLEEVLNAK